VARPSAAPLAAAALVASLVVLALPATAWSEADAPKMDGRVLSAWHDPQVPQADAPWHAFLQLKPESNVTGVLFQVCRVGKACFGPPAAAEDMGNATFGFASSLAGGSSPVDFAPGWHIGIKWYLRDANGTLTELPPSPEGMPECVDPAALACQEAHYLTFDLAPATPSPAPPALVFGVALLALAAWRRHG